MVRYEAYTEPIWIHIHIHIGIRAQLFFSVEWNRMKLNVYGIEGITQKIQME